jgi:glycosyltransferase involved in cell wall biosynthesis
MKTSNKPKVLMLSIGYGTFGGTELSAERLRNWLVDNGIDVDVISGGKSKDIIRVPTLGLWRVFWPIFAYIISVSYVLRKKVDVIYTRYATYPLFVGVVLKKISRKPLIVSIHGGDIRHGSIFGKIIAWFLKRADVVVCYDNTEHIEKIRKIGIEPVIIDNGIDTRRFKPSKVKCNKKTAIYVGGVREIKGWFNIITIANSNDLANRDDFEFYLYANDTFGSGKVVKYMNRVPHDKMEEVYKTGQLFILPSYAEGVPGSMLEAMASGMFVIASDLDFTRKVLDKKFLFDPTHHGDVVDLIKEFCDNKREFFGDQDKKNRKIVVENYSIDTMGQKWKDLILGLVND